MRRTGAAAAMSPFAAAILAACGKPTTTPGAEGAGSEIIENPARPDNPVTLPTEGNEPIPDGLKPEKGPLEVYNWEEYINPRVVGMFEEQYGVKVNVNTFNTMQDALATLTTSSDVNFDVFFPTVDVIGKLAITKILKPLNKNYIPNLANVWRAYQGTDPGTPFYDVGAQFTAPYTVYTTGIGWRVDQPRGSDIKGPSEEEVLGMSNPWDILWDTKYAGKIHILDDYREAICMCIQRNKGTATDPNTDNPADLEIARQNLLELVSSVDVKADISDYTDLPEGQSLIHQGWSGDFPAAQWYFPDYQTNKDVIRYWTPEDRMVVGNDLIAVLNTGKNPVLAHHFLNFMLEYNPGNRSDPGSSIVNFQWNGYLPPMTGLTADDVIKDPKIGWEPGRIVQPSLASTVPSEEAFANGIQLLELTPDVDQMWKEVWEAFQTAS